MLNRVCALLWLRIQVIFSNKSLLLQILIPFAFVYFYKYLLNTQREVRGQENLFLLAICLPFSLAMAVGNPITVILAEEKEKYNLRTLLLAGIKKREYIISTLILPVLLSFIVMVTVPFLLGISIVNILSYSIVVLLTATVVMALYLFMGLVTRSQVEAQVFSIPAMLFVAFLPMMSNLDGGIAKVVDYSFMGLFTEYVAEWKDFSWEKAIPTLFSLLCWFLILVIANFLAVKKKNRI